MSGYTSKAIALLIFVLTAACVSDPDSGTDKGSGSDSDSGSGSGTPALTEEYCKRLDSCNFLMGSVEECIQDDEADLNAMPKNQREELELEIKQCLEHPSCDGFDACLDTIFG